MATIQITNPKVIEFFERNKVIDVNSMMEIFVNFMEHVIDANKDDMASNHHSMLLQGIADNIRSIDVKIDSQNDKIQSIISSRCDMLLSHVRDAVQSGTSKSQSTVCSLLDSHYASLRDQITLSNRDDAVECQLNKFYQDMKKQIEDILSKHKGETNVMPAIEGHIKEGYGSIQQCIQMDRQDNRCVIESIHEKLILQKETVDRMDAYLTGNNKSSVKGKQGEIRMISILNDMLPDAEVIDTHGKSECGDAIVKRTNKDDILIDTKDYDGNVPPKEVDKILRDMGNKKAHGILVSQSSGISGKKDLEIGIHNNKIVVYIHSGQYEQTKLRVAISIIDNLAPFLKDHTNESHEISNDVLTRINEDYRVIAKVKIDLIDMKKKHYKDEEEMISKIDLPNLSTYLNTKFQDTITANYPCTMCGVFKGITRQSLSAHKRHCNKKKKPLSNEPKLKAETQLKIKECIGGISSDEETVTV